MTAYNTTDLYNKAIADAVEEVSERNCISKESAAAIIEAHPCTLYTPNFMIRIGLTILTLICTLFFGGLLAMMFDVEDSASAIVLLLMLSIILYVGVEAFIKSNHYYNAGVDNTLMLLSLLLFVVAFVINDYSNNYILAALFGLLVSGWFCIRFTDAFMAVLAFIALFLLVFLLYIKLGTIAKATAPLVMMIIAPLVYAAMQVLAKKESLLFYQFSIQCVSICACISFYACGNYFVVKELSNAMFHLQLGVTDTIPMGWLFWLFTIIIPPAYMVYGIYTKRLDFIRTALVLIAVSVFTVRYYYHVLSPEMAMLFGGVILIAICYWLIRYLTQPRAGFTFEPAGKQQNKLRNAEALIIAQTFNAGTHSDGADVQFGGGSSGGGGADSSY